MPKTSSRKGKKSDTTTALAPRSFFPLSLLTPQTVSKAARISGVLFVLLGGFLSLYHLPSTIEANHQLAQTTTNQTPPAPSVTDPKPDGQFLLQSSGVSAAGTLVIDYQVPNATKVTFQAREAATGEMFTIGTAAARPNNIWRRSWETIGVPDGKYELLAVIQNEFGSYDDRSDSKITIDNNPDLVFEPITIDFKAREPGGVWKSELLEVTTENDIAIRWAAANADSCSSSGFDANQKTSGEVLVPAPQPESELVLIVECTNPEFEKASRIIVKNVLEQSAAIDYDEDTVVDVSYETENDTPVSEDQTTDTTEKVPESEQGTLNGTQPPATSNTSGNEVENLQPILVDETSNDDKIEEVIQPKIELRVPNTELSGTVTILVRTERASFVELYARNKFSSIDRFVGLANRVSPGEWREIWDTTLLPNGEYRLFAKVKNEFGLYESEASTVKIVNLTTVANPDIATEYSVQVERLTTIEAEVSTESAPVTKQPIIDAMIQNAVAGTDESADAEPEVIEQLQSSVDEITATSNVTSDDSVNTFEKVIAPLVSEEAVKQRVLDAFEAEVESIFREFRVALRRGDDQAVAEARAEMEQVRATIVDSILSNTESEDLLEQIDDQLARRIERKADEIERREVVIRDRAGEEALRDSDGDEITDYDEVNLYNTNPFSADTDNDGINDNIELERGFDPNNDAVEALVRYESPKEVEEVREDILVVESITTIAPNPDIEDTSGVDAKAVITGRALPNSFVTIYIFSEPIVVTVRTDETGAWSYTFDKELADGTHEVYVGITDNAGKIIARSNPFEFIKTAEAFTPVDAATGAALTPETGPSLLNSTIMLLVGSVSIVAIGLVLILLGLYLDRKEHLLVPQQS